MIGEGPYDAEATELIQKLRARGVVVMVFGGDKGTSYAVTVGDTELLLSLPRRLIIMAGEIEMDIHRMAETRNTNASKN